MSLAPGSRIGPYEILSRLGAGGMGEVWKARDTRLDRSVAVKILPSELASDAQLKLRFDREARTISQLEHPNICRLYDVGQSPLPGSEGPGDEVQYLVMELLDGESLADRLQRGPLPLADVLRYGAEIAEALAVAHRAGVIHRDLKPGNVMITRSGAKLLDFGLAKAAGGYASGTRRPASGSHPSVESETSAPTYLRATAARPLTEEGTILGTFQYMSPEQLEGLDADERSDIFALGCVLYEMLTGTRAFDGKTRTSLIAAIVAGTPRPVAELQPLTPPQLEHIVTTCLEKDPDRRWQSAHDVARELRWIATAPRSAESEKRRSRAWALPVAVLIALLAGAALGALVMRSIRGSETRDILHASLLPPKGVEVELPQGDGDNLVLSPSGRTLAFVGREPAGKVRLWLRELGRSDARVIEGTDGAAYPFWSHDGRSIAFFANGKLKKVTLDGSPPVTICDVASNPLSGDWNAEDVILFSPASGAPLHRVPAAGGTSEAITTLDTKTGETTHRWARFLPDGRNFLYTAGSHDAARNSEVNAVYAGSLGSAERKLILRSRYQVEYLDGHLLYVRGEGLVAQEFDAGSLELRGEPRVVVDRIHTAPESFIATFNVAEGTLIYGTGGGAVKREMVFLDVEGKELGNVLEPGDYVTWDASPDGSRIAYTVEDPTAGADIWIKDIARGALTRLTIGGTGDGPVWSPDGRRIGFNRGGWTMAVKEIDRDTEPEVLLKRESWTGLSAWSPDGKYLALWTFDPRGATRYDALILPLDGTKTPLPLATTTADEFPLAFAPDGKWITYVSNITGRSEIYVVALPGLNAKQQISTGGGNDAFWTPAGELWYRRTDRTWVSVTLQQRGDRLEISEPRVRFRDDRIVQMEPAGGDRLLATRRVGEPEPTEVRVVSNWRALLQ